MDTLALQYFRLRRLTSRKTQAQKKHCTFHETLLNTLLSSQGYFDYMAVFDQYPHAFSDGYKQAKLCCIDQNTRTIIYAACALSKARLGPGEASIYPKAFLRLRATVSSYRSATPVALRCSIIQYRKIKRVRSKKQKILSVCGLKNHIPPGACCTSLDTTRLVSSKKKKK